MQLIARDQSRGDLSTYRGEIVLSSAHAYLEVGAEHGRVWQLQLRGGAGAQDSLLCFEYRLRTMPPTVMTADEQLVPQDAPHVRRPTERALPLTSSRLERCSLYQ